MDNLELRFLFDEHNIAVPDKCVSCVRLGGLATELSKEHEAITSIKAHDVDVLFNGFVKPMIIESLTKQYPDETSEQIEARALEGLAKVVTSGELSEENKNLGALLGAHMERRDEITRDINNLLEACPPEGHTD